MAGLYRGFQSQAELDAEYDVEAVVGDFPAYLEHFESASRRALAELNPTLRIPYGPTVAEHLDIYPAQQANAPVLVFFHGGYWHRLSSQDFAFAALGPVAHGITVVNVNYALCPEVAIDEIVREARAAVAWTAHSIAGHGGDPRRLHVGGHSAGAHLATMCLLTPWERDYALPPGLLKGGALVSGLYDLRPLPFTFIQPALQLTWRQILRLSPALVPERIEAPVLI
ncbi:MAG: alpha/beta hydrolase, partial [Acetobacteraceae bacterium]